MVKISHTPHIPIDAGTLPTICIYFVGCRDSIQYGMINGEGFATIVTFHTVFNIFGDDDAAIYGFAMGAMHIIHLFCFSVQKI